MFYCYCRSSTLISFMFYVKNECYVSKDLFYGQNFSSRYNIFLWTFFKFKRWATSYHRNVFCYFFFTPLNFLMIKSDIARQELSKTNANETALKEGLPICSFLLILKSTRNSSTHKTGSTCRPKQWNISVGKIADCRAKKQERFLFRTRHGLLLQNAICRAPFVRLAQHVQ